MNEEWLTVPGFDAYEVSSLGNVRRSKPGIATFVGRPVRPMGGATGYAMVRLSNMPGSKQAHLYVHRIVMSAFVGECPDGHVVNHKNGNKLDNRLDNLEYVTRRQNCLHAHANLPRHKGPTKPPQPLKGKQVGDRHWTRRHPERIARGERMGGAKLRTEQVSEIKRRIADGEKQTELAREFGVCVAQLSRIAHGKRWAHVEAA